MKKRASLQWQLTLMTALLVAVSCLSLSYFISKTAVLYMDEIEDSVVAVFPKEMFDDGGRGETEVYLDITGSLSGQIRDTQTEFWGKSLLVTLLTVLAASALTYFAVGCALRPLRQLGRQVEEIQAKNMQQPVEIQNGSREIAGLTDAFNAMLQRLSEAFFAQRQFSANAAHELRTPLAVMQAKLEVLQKQEQPAREDYAEAVCMVQTQTERLSHVIDVLLEMTQLHAAKRDAVISLAEVTEEVLCDLAPLGAKKEVTLSQTPGDAKIFGSDTLVCRAIYNLVENAIKYNRAGGTVTVGIRQEDAFAQVTVTDSGCGIGQDDWDKIFEPFFRVDKSRSRAMGGAGLGLALVREIARRHGGDVRVLQSSAQGTQIALSFRIQSFPAR